MNVNEVLANRAIQLLDGEIGSKSPVHPNDDINMGQSSNDTFPTAMHIAAVLELKGHLFPCAESLAAAIEAKSEEWRDVVARKLGLAVLPCSSLSSWALRMGATRLRISLRNSASVEWSYIIWSLLLRQHYYAGEQF
jgi:hypothetical protein